MALMLPSFCPVTAPPGERELFRRLRDDPDTKSWIILHSLDLVRHVDKVAGEADFVIIVPEYGILVLEVKSHRTMHVDERGWHFGRSEVDSRGPFKQAADAMYSIRNYLIDSESSLGLLIISSAVCFPYLDFRRRSPEWHDWQIIDRARLTSAPISRLILGILSQCRQLLAQKGNPCAKNPARHASVERCEAVSRVLRPRFEIAISPKAQRRDLDEGLLRLTEEQFSALDQVSLNRRVVFSGPAGTGKTVLAMEALRRVSTSGLALRPALFCFNRLLGLQLQKKAATAVPSTTVGHIDGWLSKTAGSLITKDDRSRPDFFNGRLISLAIDSLLRDDTQGAPFDFLVLDEAQDLLQPHYLDVIDLVLEGGLAGGRWLMFGDFVGQDIFTKAEMGLEEFIRERCPTAFQFLLTTNCRNTRAISEYVVALGRLSPPYGKVLRPDDHRDPELHFWNSRAQQRSQVESFIRKCLAEGFALQDIVMLSPRAERSLGQEMAFDSEWSSRLAPWGSKSTNCIGYATIHAFKGLEAPVVIITDFEAMESKQQQSLFYIGLSRALHQLGIFLQEDLKSFVRSIT